MKKRRKTKIRGLALPLVVISCAVLVILIFSIQGYQSGELRLLQRSFERQKAFKLAEAGLQRFMGRYVAEHWSRRWYRSAEDRDGLDYQGVLSSDDEATRGKPIDPRGRYDVYVEDRPRYPKGSDVLKIPYQRALK